MHASHRGKEAARAFPIKGGRRRGTAHLLGWTRVVAFKAPVPHDHGVEISRFTCLLNSSPLATCPPCPKEGRWWTRRARAIMLRRETGSSLIGAAGRSRFSRASVEVSFPPLSAFLCKPRLTLPSLTSLLHSSYSRVDGFSNHHQTPWILSHLHHELARYN